MDKYNEIREDFEKAYKEYLEKLEIYNLEYEKGRIYVESHKCTYKELAEKAKDCSDSRIKANCLWNICLSHPLHYYVSGYLNPEISEKYGIK